MVVVVVVVVVVVLGVVTVVLGVVAAVVVPVLGVHDSVMVGVEPLIEVSPATVGFMPTAIGTEIVTSWLLTLECAIATRSCPPVRLGSWTVVWKLPARFCARAFNSLNSMGRL